jgi:large subunit ribosomal protein L25
MPNLVLKGEKREIKGKKVKNLRAQGLIPAVLYGHGVESSPLVISYNDFEKVYDKAGGSALITLDIAGEPHNVLIHEVEIEPVSQKYQHADFYQVKMTEKITAEVPLHFVGESMAVQEQDGVLVKNFDTLEVSCLPGDLPQHIEVNIDVLKNIDDVIHISDLQIPSEVEVLKDKEEVIATVTPPRTEEELAELEEEVSEEEAVEGVEVEGKAEEGEEEGEVSAEEGEAKKLEKKEEGQEGEKEEKK